MEDTQKSTHWPRHANPKIIYDGQEAEKLYHNIISMEYTDCAEGNSDEIVIHLSDPKKDWLSGWFPEKTHNMEVYIDYYNWTRPETVAFYHCGNFTIDDISVSGGSREITIKGVSQPAGGAFKETRQSKSWKKITLKQIAAEIMQKYGMTDLYFYGDETVIQEVVQEDQTDCDFLNKLCEKYGYSLKIYKLSLVIYRKSIYEAGTCIREFDGETEWEDWDWNTTLSGTYTGARISYTNPSKKRKAKDITITVGSEERLLIISEKADNEAEAIEIAKSRVNKENEKAETLSFTMMFDPTFFASMNFEVKNLPHVAGKYFIEKVQVKMSKSGLKMSVSAYKIFGRL